MVEMSVNLVHLEELMLIALLGSLVLSGPGHPQGRTNCCGGDMTPFLTDPSFLAAHLTPKEYTYKGKDGSSITIKDANGKDAGAFYVAPAPGNKTAIIMVHEFWGLNEFIKQEAQKVHDATGYAVLAVDLYEGKVGKTAQEARQYMSSVDKTRATAIVSGAVKDLKRGDLGVRFGKIGTVGFCFGGGWSHETAIQGGKNVQACVVYYGMPDLQPSELAKLKAPVLMIHATKDQWINDKVVSDFQSAMKSSGKSLEVLHYDANHAFANPSNPIYDKKSADDAFEHVIAFYKKNLG